MAITLPQADKVQPLFYWPCPLHLLFQDTSDTTHREGPAGAAIVHNLQTSTHILVTSNHSNWTGRTAIMLFPDSCSSIIPWNCQVV